MAVNETHPNATSILYGEEQLSKIDIIDQFILAIGVISLIAMSIVISGLRLIAKSVDTRLDGTPERPALTRLERLARLERLGVLETDI